MLPCPLCASSLEDCSLGSHLLRAHVEASSDVWRCGVCGHLALSLDALGLHSLRSAHDVAEAHRDHDQRSLAALSQFIAMIRAGKAPDTTLEPAQKPVAEESQDSMIAHKIPPKQATKVTENRSKKRDEKPNNESRDIMEVSQLRPSSGLDVSLPDPVSAPSEEEEAAEEISLVGAEKAEELGDHSLVVDDAEEILLSEAAAPDQSQPAGLTKSARVGHSSTTRADASAMETVEETAGNTSDPPGLSESVVAGDPALVPRGGSASLLSPVCPVCDVTLSSAPRLRHHLHAVRLPLKGRATSRVVHFENHGIRLNREGKAVRSEEVENEEGVKLLSQTLTSSNDRSLNTTAGLPGAGQLQLTFELSCAECGETMGSLAGLRAHVFQAHNIRTRNRRFCVFCQLHFHSEKAGMDHTREVHGRQKSSRIVCGVCRLQGFNRMGELVAHVSGAHGLDLELSRRTFPSGAEFEAWLLDAQRNTGFWLWNKNGSRKSDLVGGAEGISWWCKASDAYRRRNVRRRSSEDFAFTCSAFVSGRRDVDGSVTLTYSLHHYGHLLDDPHD